MAPSKDDIIITQWSEEFYTEDPEGEPSTIGNVQHLWGVSGITGNWLHETGYTQDLDGLYAEYNYDEDDPSYDSIYHNIELSGDQIAVAGTNPEFDKVILKYRFGLDLSWVPLTDYANEEYSLRLTLLRQYDGTHYKNIDNVLIKITVFDSNERWVEDEVEFRGGFLDMLSRDENNDYFTKMTLKFDFNGEYNLPDTAKFMVDYMGLYFSNEETCLYWDDENTMSYEDLVSMTHNTDDNAGIYGFMIGGDDEYQISDERNLFTGVTGYGSTDLLMTDVSNWKNKTWDIQGWFPMEWSEIIQLPNTIGTSNPNDFVLLDFDLIYNIYNRPDLKSGENFDYLELPFYIFEAQKVDNVNVKISYKDGSYSNIEIDVESTESGFFSHVLKKYIGGRTIESIRFEIVFDPTATADEYATLAFEGLALYTPQSLGMLRIKADNSPDFIDHVLLPTPFTGITAPEIGQFDLGYTDDIVEINQIQILGPVGWTSNPQNGLYGSDLCLNSISIISRNTTGYDYNPLVYYSYSFDEGHRDLIRKMTEWYSSASFGEEWTDLTSVEPYIETLKWVNQYSIDYDGDSVYDLKIQEFDGEGLGIFDNNIMDTILIDEENDGIWDLQILYDTLEYDIQVTDPEAYGTGGLYSRDYDGHYYTYIYKFRSRLSSKEFRYIGGSFKVYES